MDSIGSWVIKINKDICQNVKKKDHEGRVVQLDAIMFSVGGTFNEYLNGKVCIFCTVYNVM